MGAATVAFVNRHEGRALFGRGNKKVIGVFAILVVVGLIAFVEAHHQIPFFRALTFALVFVLLTIATMMTRGVLRNSLLVASTLALGLSILEISAIMLEQKPVFVQTPQSLVPRPVIGWGPGFVGTMHAHQHDQHTGAISFDVDYTIDDHFDRKVNSSASGPAVVFFGDSYTFGVGLNDADTLPQRFSDLFEGKRRVLNLAVSGFSPQQFLSEVQTGLKDDVIGPKPAAIIFLTSPFHAMRTACKESWVLDAPRFQLVDGKVVSDGACYQGVGRLAVQFLESTALYRVAIRPFSVRLTHNDVDLYIRILAEAARAAKAKYGVEPLIPYVQATPAYLASTGYTNDAILGELQSRGVHAVDMTLHDDPGKGLAYTIPGDGHPSALANRVRARMIADALGDLGTMADTSVVQSGKAGPPVAQ